MRLALPKCACHQSKWRSNWYKSHKHTLYIDWRWSILHRLSLSQTNLMTRQHLLLLTSPIARFRCDVVAFAFVFWLPLVAFAFGSTLRCHHYFLVCCSQLLPPAGTVRSYTTVKLTLAFSWLVGLLHALVCDRATYLRMAVFGWFRCYDKTWKLSAHILNINKHYSSSRAWISLTLIDKNDKAK